MRVALIHDHLAQMGGAEKVLQVLQEMYPDAPIYTLMYKEANVRKNFPGSQVIPSIIQKMPFGINHYRWYMALMPMALEFIDLTDFDLVISSTSSFAKGVITTPDTLHICYCHTPTRYLWSDTHEYINALNYNKFFKKIISLVLNYIRMWDKLAADRVDFYIANSLTVKKRIKKYYKRESEIIYPSIEEEKFYISAPEKIGDFFLAGCRLVPYKHLDIVIEAFKKSGLRLKIFGDGVDSERLQGIANGSKNIEFLGRVSDQERSKLYSECQAYINPQVEDFGITIVEAMASGRPVIALGKGGATETIIEGKTGLFIAEESAESVGAAVEAFRRKNIDWNPAEIRAHALQFSKANFKKNIESFVAEKYKEFSE